jgi:hypothetical protein
MKQARKSMCFLRSLAALVLLFAIMYVHARVRQTAEMVEIGRMAAMVREVGLTDLCLFIGRLNGLSYNRVWSAKQVRGFSFS